MFALYHTKDAQGCMELLDALLEGPDTGVDKSEYLRLRAAVRRLAGDVPGAIKDLETVVARYGGSPLTSDLLAIVQARAVAGHTHELAAAARQLRKQTDLEASEALRLAGMLASDDPYLAREFWRLAEAKGISDDDVARAVELGYRLGIDQSLGQLHQRMVSLAMAGHRSILPYTTDEVFTWFRDRGQQRDKVLDLYRRGQTSTHMVAEFLGEPLAHFFHFLPAVHETGQLLRHRFALQLRSGRRPLPVSSLEISAPGRLALDLSALLLAAHLGILDAIEEQFRPIRLPSLAIPALHEQREKLKPHQPSRLEIAKEILRAERRGGLETWQGDLPILAAEDRVAAGAWWRWLALLERAFAEDAFVLDIPLTGDEEHGRPQAMAGEARLLRLVTVADIRVVLHSLGALPLGDPGQGQHALPGSDAMDTELSAGDEGAQATEEAAQDLSEPRSSPRPSFSDVVYMTDGGSEALAFCGPTYCRVQRL